MNRFLTTATVLLPIVALAVPAAAAQPNPSVVIDATPPVPTTQDSLGALAENVEILSRILDKSLRDGHAYIRGPEEVAGPGETVAVDSNTVAETYTLLALATRAGRPRVDRTRGWIVPGFGAFFSVSVSVPTRTVDAPKPTAVRTAQDLWEQTRNQVRGHARKAANVRKGERKQRVIDAAGVERAVETIIKSVAEHGWRLEQLGSDESIVVTARVTGSVVGLELGGVRAQNYGLPMTEAAKTFYAVRNLPAAPARQVVIRLTKRDLESFHDGAVEIEALRTRAVVVEYAVPGTPTRATWATLPR